MVSVRYLWRASDGCRSLVLLLSVLLLAACVAPDFSSRPAAVLANDPLLHLVYRDADSNARVASVSTIGLLTPLSVETTSTSTPLLRGLSYNNITHGARIPALYTPLLISVASLKQQLPGIYSGVSEITLVNKSRSSYEIRLSTHFTSLPIVSTVPISIDNLEIALAAATHPALTAISNQATHISIRGATPVIRYDQL